MITILKLAGVSAVLSAGVVTAFEPPQAPVSGKIYQDRIIAEPAGPVTLADASAATVQKVANDAGPSSGPDCRAQAWPYVSRDCMSADGNAARKAVRTITIERRDAPNTSTLVRLPVGN